jgi:hypothetical protein
MMIGGIVTMTSGCVTYQNKKNLVTLPELKPMGTRTYPGLTGDQAEQAVTTALKVLGYEIVTTSPRIRTAPKNMITAAYYYSSSAVALIQAVAWDITVTSSDKGTTIVAEPHPTMNGQPMDKVYKDWAATNFNELFKEIEAAVPK